MDDVKDQAEPTAAESSDGEQTTQDQPEQAAETQPTDDLAAKTVPYTRFKEANEKWKGEVEQLQSRLQQLEAKQTPQQRLDPQIEQVKQQLKDLGFVSKDEVERMSQQERENLRVEQQLTKLESQYDGKDGRPKFDRREVVEFALSQGIANPEIAYKTLHEKDLTDWHIQQALAKSGGVKSEASDGSGSAQSAGVANDDLKQAAIAGDKNALKLYLKRLVSS